jgi:hypothetical protein
MIAPPPPTELSTVASLLAVIADPKRAAEALAAMQALTDEYRALVAKSEEDRLSAIALRDEAARIGALAAQDRKAAIELVDKADARARVLASREKDFAAVREAFDTSSQATSEALAQREAVVAERETQVSVREREADEMKKVSEALVAEYNDKLAKLRQVMG